MAAYHLALIAEVCSGLMAFHRKWQTGCVDLHPGWQWPLWITCNVFDLLAD